jgi:hypothetical protein
LVINHAETDGGQILLLFGQGKRGKERMQESEKEQDRINIYL